MDLHVVMANSVLRHTALAAVTSLVVASGCGPAPLQPGLPPSPTKGPSFVTGNLEPLVVDWQPEQRGDVEVAMREGLVVVGYDDNGFRLLKDCHVDGNYEFMGMTRREKVIRLETADDIRANLPLGGLGLAAQLGGELERGATLDIAMVMIGKLRTTWRQVGKNDLKGQCEGATHVVRGATVGAFAVDTGQRANARAAAEVFAIGASGGSRSAKSVHITDGRLDDCATSSPDGAKAPAQCGAMIRIELLPVSTKTDAKAKEAELPALDACPKPLVRVDGKCTQIGAAAPPPASVECTYGDGAGCVRQCEAGNAASCTKLSQMLVRGDGVERAPNRAALPAARGCDGNDGPGCGLLGGFLMQGVGVDRDLEKAARAWAKGCDAGDAPSCGSLGTQFLTGQGVQRDTKIAATALARSCRGGYHAACSDLGLVFLGGSGFDKDLPRAAQLFKRACDGDGAVGCANYAYMAEFGQGISKDPSLAVKNYVKACELDDSSCTWAAAMLQMGKGLPKDESKAVGLYRLSCQAGAVVSCAILHTYVDPKVKVDAEEVGRYVNVWKGTCESGIPRDCSGLGVLAITMGQKAEGQKLLAQGCKLGDEWGCLMQRMQTR